MIHAGKAGKYATSIFALMSLENILLDNFICHYTSSIYLENYAMPSEKEALSLNHVTQSIRIID